MLKLLGIAAVLAAAFFAGRELISRKKMRLCQLEEFHKFISYIRLQIGCYLKPVSEICRGFESELLRETGFLGELAEGASLSAAFEKIRGELYITSQEADMIFALFSSVGQGYMEDEIKLMDNCLEEYSRLLRERREKTPEEIKLAATLTAAAALSLVILLL